MMIHSEDEFTFEVRVNNEPLKVVNTFNWYIYDIYCIPYTRDVPFT